jgi:hypothetical protein
MALPAERLDVPAIPKQVVVAFVSLDVVSDQLGHVALYPAAAFHLASEAVSYED